MITNSEARAGAPQSLPGEEELRFIRNFHDIFLSIGILMFAAGLAMASAIALGPRVEEAFRSGEDGWRGGLGIVAAASGANAVVMWLMAEFFARGRRLFLPSIVILLAFAWFVVIAAGALYGLLEIDRDYLEALEGMVEGADHREMSVPTAVVGAFSDAFLFVGGAVTAAILLFYARMRLPFAMGLGAYSLAMVAVVALFRQQPDRIIELANPAQLYAGLFLFLLGVFFDARDPERRSRLSDNAFWLHFFAAPLILNSSVSMAVGQGSEAGYGLGMAEALAQSPTTAAVATLAVVAGLSFVSLLINRRALLVAGLLYALVAAGYLISKTGLSGAWTIAVTLLVLGGAMVLLGGGWHALRRIIVAPFPKSGLIARIIPPEPSKEDRRRAVSE